MSIRAMNLVGERSRAAKNDLLLLLKIADGCDDEGRNCWMETPAMARWMRATDRGAQLVLGRLQRLREVEIEINERGREIILRGGRRFMPKWFIHVRCVSAWDEYQTESEESSHSTDGLLRGRPARKSERISHLPKSEMRTKRPRNPNETAEKCEETGSAYKEGSLNDSVVDPEAASAGLTETDYEALRLAWNERTTWPLKPIDELTPKRRARLHDALAERPVDQWCFVFDKVEASTFLRGGGRQGFIARFEWVLRFEHAIAILEGQYDDHFSEAELGAARSRLANTTGGRCPHTPDCRSSQECVRKYALLLRARAGAA